MIGPTRTGTRGSADLRGCVAVFRAAGQRSEGRPFLAASSAYARNARVRSSTTHKLNAFRCKACKTVLDHVIEGGRMEDREREGISGLQQGSARLMEVETRFCNATDFGGLTHELSLGG